MCVCVCVYKKQAKTCESKCIIAKQLCETHIAMYAYNQYR